MDKSEGVALLGRAELNENESQDFASNLNAGIINPI